MNSTERRLDQCQQIIGYYFSSPTLLETALTHSSLRAPDRECNERLEFLGDSVLGLVITEELYHLLPDQSEGELTRIKSAVVSRSALLSTSQQLGLQRYAEFARGVGKRDKLPASVVANLVEAIIGAIYLDAGYYPAREFVLRHMGAALDDELNDRGAKNYKSLLQHEVQQAVGVTPTYRTLDADGPDHAKEFVVAAIIRGQEWGRATGPTKKDAEQEGARMALEAWERRGRGRRRRRKRKSDASGVPVEADAAEDLLDDDLIEEVVDMDDTSRQPDEPEADVPAEVVAETPAAEPAEEPAPRRRKKRARRRRGSRRTSEESDEATPADAIHTESAAEEPAPEPTPAPAATPEPTSQDGPEKAPRRERRRSRRAPKAVEPTSAPESAAPPTRAPQSTPEPEAAPEKAPSAFGAGIDEPAPKRAPRTPRKRKQAASRKAESPAPAESQPAPERKPRPARAAKPEPEAKPEAEAKPARKATPSAFGAGIDAPAPDRAARAPRKRKKAAARKTEPRAAPEPKPAKAEKPEPAAKPAREATPSAFGAGIDAPAPDRATRAPRKRKKAVARRSEPTTSPETKAAPERKPARAAKPDAKPERKPTRAAKPKPEPKPKPARKATPSAFGAGIEVATSGGSAARKPRRVKAKQVEAPGRKRAPAARKKKPADEGGFGTGL